MNGLLVCGVIYNAVIGAFFDASEKRHLLGIACCVAGWLSLKLMWPGF